MCSLESYPILSVAPGQPVNTRLLQLGEISTQIRTVTGGGGRLRRRGVCQKHVHQKAVVDVNLKFCIFFSKNKYSKTLHEQTVGKAWEI